MKVETNTEPRLTERQTQCLFCASLGFSNKEVARALGCAPETVTKHLKAVYRTLDVGTRSEAVAWARNNGKIPKVNTPLWGIVSRNATWSAPDSR